jgi:hypothetical protein
MNSDFDLTYKIIPSILSYKENKTTKTVNISIHFAVNLEEKQRINHHRGEERRSFVHSIAHRITKATEDMSHYE